MKLFKGNDDVRYDAWHSAANRAKAAGDETGEARRRAKADEVAETGDVSAYAKSGLGWDKKGRLI